MLSQESKILAMNTENGQKQEVWDDWWGKRGLSPLSEIQMWDFYGGRQWITKYVPRFGKVVEGGCGLGRYVFYLKQLGIDIEGIDFSHEAVDKLNEIKHKIEASSKFNHGDVTDLPYEDNSISGYISLGVVEHFIEGPQKAIAEAYRVLKPGGIAIITVPNKSFYIRYKKPYKLFKKTIKKLIGKKIVFFQYEYSPWQLKKYCSSQGFYVSRAEGCDLLYTFGEMHKFDSEKLKPKSVAYRLAHQFENTFLKNFGAQTITISIKTAPLMHCFLSGKLSAKLDSLQKFDVPISREMEHTELANLYRKGKKVKYACKYLINPPKQKQEPKTCEFSKKEYLTDPIFEDYGFNRNVAPDYLIKPEINIPLSVESTKPIWRKKK